MKHILKPSRILAVLATGCLLAFSAGTALAAPTIVVKQGATVLTSGSSTFAFASTQVGASSAATTFTIENTGSPALAVTGVTTTTGNSADFTVNTTGMLSSVGAGGSTTFSVTFSPTGSGSRTTSLRIANNDNTTFIIALTGTGNGAEITVTQGSAVTDGGNSAIGTVDLGTSTASVSKTFTIANIGNEALSITAPVITGADFSLTTPPAASLAVGSATTTFVVKFEPTTVGNKTGTVTIGTNDLGGTRSSFNINLTGTATGPEIEIVDGSTVITSGDTNPTLFTTVDLGTTTTTSSKTFTLKNTAAGTLTLSNATITGGAGFSITSQPAVTTLSGVGNTTFAVQFAPTARGVQNATISIPNNDADEAPFVLNIRGTAIAPVLEIQQPAPTVIAAAGTVAFGNVQTTKPIGRIFTVKNAGDASLNFATQPVLGGADNRQFTVEGTVPAAIAAGASATINVTFAPAQERAHVATLSFSSNASTTAYLVNLTGTGVSAAVGGDDFGYKSTVIAGGNILPFLTTTDPTVITEATLTGIDKAVPVDLGFQFLFYDKSYSQCSISTTGLITFGASSVDYTPDTIPLTGAPDNFIAPLWTDLQIDATSKILYKTIGASPDRIFIVKYHQARLYNNGSNTGKRVSFQVQLYETTNNIQIRYLDETPTLNYPLQGYNVGIESRNYGTESPRPGEGVVGNTGITGIQHSKGTFTATSGPDILPSGSLLFTRPVLITVESKYAKPVPTVLDPNATVATTVGSAALGVNPLGTIYKTPYNSVKRFEAPEFIYLDKDFNELPAAGEINATNPAVYRLVNDGYSIDGQVIQGAQTFFTATLTKDVTVVWRWKLQYAAFVETVGLDGNSLQAGPGVGNPSPAIGRSWYDKGAVFTSSIDRAVGNDSLGLDVAGFRYTAKTYQLNLPDPTTTATRIIAPAVALSPTGSRVAISPLTINGWIRLKWTMAAQVRYRFAAAADAANGSAQFFGQSFIRIYDAADPAILATGTTTETNPRLGTAVLNEIWIDAGRKVDVGAFYRTADRCFTLGDFISAPGGNLSSVGTSISLFRDEMVNDNPTLTAGNRVARIFTIPAATAPTEFTFRYVPTVFRAEIALGESFDATNPDLQLVPNICPGAVLRADDLGPQDSFTRVGALASGQATGAPIRWDQLGKSLFPVHPGSYQLNWPDTNDPSKVYKIEIVAAYPGDTAALASARETKLSDGNSKREISGTSFVFATTLPRVNAEFPGSLPVPGLDAHYRHTFDPLPARNMPTKFDISATDEWSFRELTYTDQGTGATTGTDSTKPFTVTGSGRSAVLYSYRPNQDEIADGTAKKERLAVRVIRSTPTAVIPRTDSRLVLGHRGLQLGNGLASSGGAYGVVQTGGAPAIAAVTSGDKFVVDFWLNAKGLKTSAPVTLTGCTTAAGSTNLVCASTTGIVPGMTLSGTNIPAGAKVSAVVNSTSLTLSASATGANTGLSIVASNKPVTVLSTGGGALNVSLDAAAATVTAKYRGIPITHSLPVAGAGWRHHAIHVFTTKLFGISITVVNYYLDGVRKEQTYVTNWFPGTANSTVAPSIDSNSLRLGVDANPLHGLAIDQFRFFNLGTDAKGYLSGSEVRSLRTERDMTVVGKGLRTVSPNLWFNFEVAPSSGRFANLGSLPNVAIGPITGSGSFVGTWANTDLQEVATRIDSTLDNAGFAGSGYILNSVSNYNADLYNRSAEVGRWGPVFPVNHSQLFTDSAKKLEITYYENPYLTDRSPNPNVAWPYITTEFQNVIYPTVGPDKDKRIFIASRIGSEGIDQNGRPQPVFDLSGYSGLKIYNQPDLAQAGYNPNEEHGLAAASGRAALKVKSLGDGVPNNLPLAAFALQTDANQTTTPYTSEPWVLLQVQNLVTGEPEMAAYAVRKTREGAVAFPRPTDAVVQSTPGLAYESAANPEDRFLTLDPNKAYDFAYKFEYPVLAGDLLIPPYPLNIVIGNVAMQDERGGNIQVDGVNRRTLWRDVNKKGWVVSGNGKFFNQFFYPMRGDFYLPTSPDSGTPVAWLPATPVFTGPGISIEPVKVIYSSKWRSNYPKLKRGETLTYQGGEYFNENPGSNGLPALVAMRASEIVYDSSTPDMVIGAATSAEVGRSSAQIIRPLDRREKTAFSAAKMNTAGFSPAESAKLLIIAERWYFKDLAGSLGTRFYYDSLASTLVFRGYLNGKDSGNSDLTSGPDPLNLLEPNVMTLDEYKAIRALSADTTWQSAIDDIFKLSQNPNGVTSPAASITAPVFLQGVKPAPDGGGLPEVREFWLPNLSGTVNSPTPVLARLDSFGVGSALVPNASLLTQNPNGSLYITIAENNRSELNGAAISLHILEVVPDRYRGAIKVVESADAFSEKVMLTHNGDFGSNTADLYYEWWIRDAASLDIVANEVLPTGNLKETDSSGSTLWQEYLPQVRIADGTLNATQKHLGLNSIIFEGRPDVTLADKLVLMRYRHKDEGGWNLVPFEFSNASQSWRPGTPAPFQWAGAANSPQLQADGSKRYIPQLVMGWVKRVLDRINPYEARYTDFFSNESPASYTSQIQIAGGPFAGKVALNSDKNVIENTGLIELYETVLQRAKELSIDNSSNPVSTDGINQALLLAATRLSVLYELLAREAYSDAQDSTITVSDEGGLNNVASFTHAFQNFEPDLMHEELSLLRGTDFRKSYPVYNRIFWNYAKGLGEAAYNVNYNVYDANSDGFINENDARVLFPQGHGDAWGHFVNGLGKHYDLLRATNFNWRTRAELYSLMQNVLEVDFLDEKTFAKLAAAKARAGRDIVRGTYRQKYTQDPDGQWQGYTDSADPARAWGVSEWGRRAGQAAYFDWIVANALLPADATGATPITNPEGLDNLERQTGLDEIGEVAAGYYEIQMAMDEADGGVNPLGFDSDAITFDIDPNLLGSTSAARATHFEQIYNRAVVAGNNALSTLDFAAKAENKLRRVADNTDEVIRESMRQDLDYRNRLIEIFGRPYSGTIGFGKAYPEGYEGPDNLLFAYLDRITVEQVVPPGTGSNDPATLEHSEIKARVAGLSSNSTLLSLYSNTTGGSAQLTNAVQTFVEGNEYADPTTSFTMPVNRTAAYAYQSAVGWGQRTSYGKIQQVLEKMLREEVGLERDLYAYSDYLGDYETACRRMLNQIEMIAKKESIQDAITGTRAGINSGIVATETIIGTLSIIGDVVGSIAEAVSEAFPTSIGFSNDVTSPARGIALAAAVAAREPINVANGIKDIGIRIAELVRDEVIDSLERKGARVDYVIEIEGMLVELGALAGEDPNYRSAIGERLQNLEILRQEYFTLQAEGFRLLREREVFNKALAATVQKSRYEDMVFRLSRNEAMSKYQTAFNAAARYAWLAAKAYDYETSLDPGHPAAATGIYDKIVKERQLGLWTDGAPAAGQNGLAEILVQMNANFQVLKGQLGINSPQSATEKISMRSEFFRIGPAVSAGGNAASDDRWKDALKARIVPDLQKLPEFVQYCRPFATTSTAAQPGLVIRFSTSIEPGVNVFGRPLLPGDHNYSSANFATKVRGFGVWLDNYNAAGLSTTPRAYLVPIGNDYLRESSSTNPFTRIWSVNEQRIPTPFVINPTSISAPGFIPTLNGVDGTYGEPRRHGDFRMYHNNGNANADDSELVLDSRLIGRSVWNSEWMLVIPGAGLHADPLTGVTQLSNTIKDIKLHFQTYSHQGQ